MRQTLGRYRILAPLGEGGMGQVFLAEDPALGRRVAIKVLPAEFSADPERRARLLEEARAASALNHPSILTIHDVGEENGVLFVAMERIEGQTLRAWRGAAPRTPRAILRVLRQAAGALAVAHDAGLVHRDLKPENMMVRSDGLLKILDFGLARSVAPQVNERTLTMPGAVFGTAPYMSPEQILGQPASPTSDVFSLAIVAYELLTGVHPFEAASGVDTMHRILHETPKPPSRRNDGLTAEVDFVLLKALAKEPARRYPNARAFEVDLDTADRSLDGDVMSATAPAVGPRALAVLPFKNIGGSPDLNYLGVGLADAVITRLSESPDLIVRSTSTIARYENQAVDPMRVAQELQATAVLDASFQRVGERFRATARLVEAPNGQSLWAGKVDLRFEDIFDVQDEVARGIADALTARLSATRAGSSVERAAPSPAAYEATMRGQEALRMGTRESYLLAIELLERATALAPGFADGWAILAGAYHGMVDGSFDDDPAWYVRADEATARALALDPEHPQARFQESALHLVRGRKVDAYRGLVRSVRAMPNNWAVHHYLAYLFRLCDRLEEAIELENTAMALEPTLPWPHPVRCRVLMQLGRLDEARQAIEQFRGHFPYSQRLKVLELGLLCTEGKYAEAVEWAERQGIGAGNTRAALFELAFAMLKVGRRDEALQLAAKFEAAAAIDMDWAAYAAALSGLADDADRAFRHLARATELGNDMRTFYADPRVFGSLHGDARWPAFIAGVEQRIARYRTEMPWPIEGKSS